MPLSRTLSPPTERHVGDSAPARAGAGRERLDLLLIGVAGVVRLLAGAWLGFRPFDDTYITFRYALNVASGLGFVYNAGEPVLGTTTPLWTLVLSGLRLLGAPLEAASLVLSLGLDAVAALLMYDLLRRLGLPRSVCLAGPLLFLATFDYLSLSRSGMESALFVAVTIATLHALAVRRFTSAGIFCALASVTRPEGANGDNVVTMPGRAGGRPEAEAAIANLSDGAVKSGLTQIRLADTQFDLDDFRRGRRSR